MHLSAAQLQYFHIILNLSHSFPNNLLITLHQYSITHNCKLLISKPIKLSTIISIFITIQHVLTHMQIANAQLLQSALAIINQNDVGAKFI